MANQPKTPLRNVRVDDDLWGKVLAAAGRRGTDASAVIRTALQVYAGTGDAVWRRLRTAADDEGVSLVVLLQGILRGAAQPRE